jgi:hypothetical protein
VTRLKVVEERLLSIGGYPGEPRLQQSRRRMMIAYLLVSRRR